MPSDVEMIETPAAGQLFHQQNPADGEWDLVLVHTIHRADEHGWLADVGTVLDTTYRLTDVPARHVI